MSRRSARISGAKRKQAELRELKLDYKNYLGTRTSFKNRPDYVRHAIATKGNLLRLHNQGYNPFCALYSIVTGLEVARGIPWTAEQRKERYRFCLNNGEKKGDHLENTLKYYNSEFKGEMKYTSAFVRTGINGKSWGNANDLVSGLQVGVCIVTLTCADVTTKFKIHAKKCDEEGGYHCIACVGFVEINNEPMFVFKDSNNHRGDRTNLTFLKASEVQDGEFIRENNYESPLTAVTKMMGDLKKNSWMLFQEIYVIEPLEDLSKAMTKLTVKLKLNF